MRIVLINPATLTSVQSVLQHAAPPIGVAYLAASVREAGHQVQVIDALGDGLDQHRRVPENPNVLIHGLTGEAVVDRIPQDTDVICVSCMFSLDWINTRNLINQIRARFPEAPIVIGGEHVSACTAYVLKNCDAVTYCVRGEGEETLVQLVDVLERGGDPAEVDGLAYRKDGQVFLTAPRSRIRAVEDIPWPAWDLIPIREYHKHDVTIGLDMGRSMPIIASRGCPYQCTFCSNPVMWGNLWRARPPADVLDEMKTYIEAYGIANFDFYDLTAIVRKDWIVEMATLIIDNKLNITWQLPSGTRSEAIDEEVTRLLYASGCRFINYAPESGSEEMLKKIKKVIKKDRMLESMGYAVRNKMHVKANILMGFPGETYRNVLESYMFIVRMALVGLHDVSIFPFSPYPGSELFMQLERQGVIHLDDDHIHSLAQFGNMFRITSYSEHIPNRMLRALMLFGIFLFYLASFTARPLRLAKMVYRLVRQKPMSKLENTLNRLIRKRRIRTA